jgi:hypothetical protein
MVGSPSSDSCPTNIFMFTAGILMKSVQIYNNSSYD